MITATRSRVALRNVRAVLADRIVDDATVVAEDGRIVSVVERGPAPPDAVDGRGAFCLPGIVDTHSDGLEKEVRPRPGVAFPLDFALSSFEGRVRAAGVTTMFHGVAFERNRDETRTVQAAVDTCVAIERCRRDGPLLDHLILHRLDVRDPEGFDGLQAELARAVPDGTGRAPLVSVEDHTPGIGQYRDTSYFSSYLAESRGVSAAEADEAVERLRVDRDSRLDQRDRAVGWLTDQARAGAIRLLAHDPTDAAEIAAAQAWGAAVAEFPTTIEAAAAALDAGMATVLGAPNVLRGGSHSGNVGAEELVAKGLCSALASDYLPSTLIAAAFRLAASQVVGLPEAVALVTSGPAAVGGLDDRGQLAPGQRADLVLATVTGDWPTVRHVVTADDAVPAGAGAAAGSTS